MTATELQRIALRLSGYGWCRHWLHWNYPYQESWRMAIQLLNREGDVYEPVRVPTLEEKGFWVDAIHGRPSYVYVIERTDEDGKPFRSDL